MSLQNEMLFDDGLVLQQVKYTGMLQTVKIRSSGYGAKFTFKVMLHECLVAHKKYFKIKKCINKTNVVLNMFNNKIEKQKKW